MEDYQARIIVETRELAKKLNSLNDFMKTKAFFELPRNKKSLLYRQSRVMNEYVEILGERMEVESIQQYYLAD